MTITPHFPSLDQVGGLFPNQWVCVGTGYSREEIKKQLLEQHGSLTGDAVTSPAGICRKITGIQCDLVDSHQRQEILKFLLKNPKTSKYFPQLKRLKRQRQFYKRMDRAIQSARLVFSHREEEEVLYRRLEKKFGSDIRKKEISALTGAYEAWLDQHQLTDEVMLYRRAIECLENSSEAFDLPQKVTFFSARRLQSLEKTFWDLLGQVVDVEHSFAGTIASVQKSWDWQIWHTLDDAAEGLARHLGREMIKPDFNPIVLVPDQPHVRRSLVRAIQRNHVPMQDPRDPTQLRWDESIKLALLPLKVVARGFQREDVVAWVQSNWLPVSEREKEDWIKEIGLRGVHRGLSAYRGGRLAVLHNRLAELHRTWQTHPAGDAHTELLGKLLIRTGNVQLVWLGSFFEKSWDKLFNDLKKIDQFKENAPLLFWYEKIVERLRDLSPPVMALKPDRGVLVHNLSHAPLPDQNHHDLFLFGLPADWLQSGKCGDYWFSDKERETLAAEFGVRSLQVVNEERQAILNDWLALSESVSVFDAQFEWNGSERESIAGLLAQLGCELEQPEYCGAYPKWRSSYLSNHDSSPVKLNLGPASEGNLVNASEVDMYSRCGFQALGAYRWKLRDLRQPEIDIWPDAKGNLLHKAVELLIESRREDGSFDRSIREAIEEAWALQPPRGLIKSKKITQFTQNRLVKVLEVFCKKEKEYLLRSQTGILQIEGQELLQMDYPEGSIQGRPDRIDQANDGIFVIDYKTSSALPSGRDMVDLGYRLQLPFYARAAQKKFNQSVVGSQLVELTSTGNRNHGIFFGQYNGKAPGSLTNTRSKLNVFDQDPEEIWKICDDHLRSHLKRYLAGEFTAEPKKDTECRSCRYSDFCGKRRQL